MGMKLFLVFLFLFEFPVSRCEDDDKYCFTLANEIHCENAANIKLKRLEGHEKGHKKKVQIEDGRDVQIETISLKPLLLEIPDFLTVEECRHLIGLSKVEGLKTSETLNRNDKNRFLLMDSNKDQRLSLEEMKLTLMGSFDVHLDKDDILQMYKEMKIDKDSDEYITQSEMASYSPKHFEIFLKDFLKSHPEKHSRYSRQVWLWPDTSEDDIFNRIINRVSSLVDLPVEILKLSDFQVVNYDIKGHYHAHWDSTDLDKKSPCCDKVKKTACRICRYMTILFYLNEVEDGGETAFPLANNATVDFQEITKQELFNLNQKCGSPGIRVKAKTGKAIIWYNHFVDPNSGWLGEQDIHTYHGGCPVRKGEKWVANFWIKVTDDKTTDLSRMHRYHKSQIKKLEKKGKDEL